MTIRRANSDDLAAIQAIQDASPGISTWEPSDYLAYDCLVAVTGGRVAAFLVSSQTGPSEREILNLAVDPAFRRQGIARKLVQEVLEASEGEWFLEVRESNLAAIELYRSMGFAPAGRRSEYYQNPTEAAIVMRILS